MRYFGLLSLSLLLACALRGQIPDNSPEATIRDALNQKSDFFGSGIMDKQLSRMGDAAAVAITKVVAGKTIDAVMVDRLVVIIKTAFSAPQIIENESDRKPRAALFVLQLLEHQSFTAEQEKKIA